MNTLTLNRISALNEQLDLWMEKQHAYEMDYIRAVSPAERFSIKSDLKREILPNIEKANQALANLFQLHDISTVALSENDYLPLLNHLANIDARSLPETLPHELQTQLTDIQQAIQAQNKSATAKLKVALPVIPLIANYELDLDTENVLSEIWHGLRGLFNKKKDRHVNP